MAIQKIPFVAPLVRTSDEAAVTKGYYEFSNCYLDEQGGINRRPAVSQYVNSGGWYGSDWAPATLRSVRGAAYFPSSGYFSFACLTEPSPAYPDTFEDINVYSFSVIGSGLSRQGVVAVTNLPGGDDLPIHSFASDGTYGFIAGIGPNREIYYGTLASGMYGSRMTDPQAPTGVTHLAWMDGYLFASNDTDTFYWSDYNNSLSWTATSYASAVGDPDNIYALHILNREIFLFGPRSLEIWYNDGETPFIRKPGGFYEIGCASRYSIIKLRNSLIWLTNDKRIVKYENGNIEEISNSFPDDLGKMVFSNSLGSNNPAGCFGYSVVHRGRTFIVFNFSAAQKTFAMDVATGLWANWTLTNPVSGEVENFPITCAAQDDTASVVFGGGLSEPYLVNFQDAAYDYISTADGGAPLKTFLRTGHVDYDTLQTKRSLAMRIRMRRGMGDSYWDSIDTTSRIPKLMLRWQDDNRAWSNYQEIDLVERGGGSLVWELRSTGIFRTRRYELSCSDPFPCVIVSGEEDLEVLG